MDDVNMYSVTGYEWKISLVNMIEKSEEILNSSLSSGSPELIIALVALGFLKPVIENQNSLLSWRSLDSWVLEIIPGKTSGERKEICTGPQIIYWT